MKTTYTNSNSSENKLPKENKNKITAAAMFLFLFSASLFAQEPVKVLFIGNSFTYYSDLPGKFKALAAAAGQTVTVDSHASAGANVTSWNGTPGHVDNPTVYAKIHSQAWDFVVIQENGAFFADPVHNIQPSCIAANIRLRDSVKAIHPCSSVIWFASWGPVGGAYSGDNTAACNNRTDTNYQWMNEKYPAKKEIIAPFGKAWNAATAAKPAIQNSIYYGDKVHPAAAGQLLNASVLYTTIFKQDPSNINYTAGVNATDAAMLRNIGYKTVMENYIFATHNLASITPVITNNSGALSAPAGYASYQWYNNNVAISGATTSSYLPATTGNYCVIATDNNGCKHFQSFPVNPSAVGIEELTNNSSSLVFPNPVTEYSTLQLSEPGAGNSIAEICTITGQKVMTLELINGKAEIQKRNLDPGMYFYKIKGSNNGFGSFLVQ